MDYFNAEIIHLDGTIEVIEYANREVVRDGVLHLLRRDPYGPTQEDLGSFPLASIRKWTKRYR